MVQRTKQNEPQFTLLANSPAPGKVLDKITNCSLFPARSPAATGAVVEVAEDLPWVPGDSTLLHQIFTNLLDNALTYRRPEVVPRIRVTWRPAADEVILAVSDNGIGIEDTYHEKIFNVFQRLHSDDAYPGTGIGLAIVKKSVNKWRGQAADRYPDLAGR